MLPEKSSISRNTSDADYVKSTHFKCWQHNELGMILAPSNKRPNLSHKNIFGLSSRKSKAIHTAQD